MPNQTNAQLVMFSGGRDSTLAAAHLMLQGIPVHLFSGNSGCSLNRDILNYRIEELKNRFGKLVINHVVENISGTFRAIAIADIETDILKYKKNLVLLGEKIALHCHVVNYCKRNNINIINDGIAHYQREYPEQRLVAKEYFVKFLKQFEIDYRSPIYDYAKSSDDVKYRLLQLGLTTKSLEGISIFSDSFSTPSDEAIMGYIEDKELLALDVIHFLIGETQTLKNINSALKHEHLAACI